MTCDVTSTQEPERAGRRGPTLPPTLQSKLLEQLRERAFLQAVEWTQLQSAVWERDGCLITADKMREFKEKCDRIESMYRVH
jgi:hypothetical protein